MAIANTAVLDTYLTAVGTETLDELKAFLKSAAGVEAGKQLVAQVEKPRFNIGNSGPPGRAD